jgi:hemerythrin-like domain-containing protein
MDDILRFTTLLSDRCHHGKKEGFLFPALIAAGLMNAGGLIAVMRSEHEQLRSKVKQTVDSLRRYQAGDKAAARQLAEGATVYRTAQGAHQKGKHHPISNR